MCDELVTAGVPYPFFSILLSPMIAGAAMSFSSVSVIGNALRFALDATIVATGTCLAPATMTIGMRYGRGQKHPSRMVESFLPMLAIPIKSRHLPRESRDATP